MLAVEARELAEQSLGIKLRGAFEGILSDTYDAIFIDASKGWFQTTLTLPDATKWDISEASYQLVIQSALKRLKEEQYEVTIMNTPFETRLKISWEEEVSD